MAPRSLQLPIRNPRDRQRMLRAMMLSSLKSSWGLELILPLAGCEIGTNRVSETIFAVFSLKQPLINGEGPDVNGSGSDETTSA